MAWAIGIALVFGFVCALSLGIKDRRRSAWAAAFILATFAVYVIRAIVVGNT